MPAREDLTGKRFGRLVCINCVSKTMSSGRKQLYWLCKCDCGKLTEVRPQSLKENRIVSCGCKNKDNKQARKDNKFSNVPEYQILRDIIRRCDPEGSTKRIRNYGARGIKVCDRWSIFGLEGLTNFLQDLGPRPSDKHTIERKDVDGDYCPENCIWTDDLSLQAFNQRSRKNKTGIPGVIFNKQTKTYSVKITYKYERIHLGKFDNLEQAAKIRKEAELKYYGFNLNWVEDFKEVLE